MATPDAPEVAPERCLAPTDFLDSDNPAVIAFAERTIDGVDGDKARAIALYYAVRDGIRYDAYRVTYDRPGLKASKALGDGYGFCITKAALLTAAARAVGIPSRLGYGDVINHFTTEKLKAQMKTDVFTYHGYSELFIDGRWVKATPAFNLSMCEKFGTLPLEFDGETDSLFHPFTADGSKHMEYVRDRGVFADIPYEEIRAAWGMAMDTPIDEFTGALEGDFYEDGEMERLARS